MMEYTVTEIRELIEELPVIKIDASLAADAAETHAVVDAFEGVLELVEGIPRKARYGALASAGAALPADGALYLPVASNCSLSAGISLATDGRAAFAVKALASSALVEHFAARDALRHAATGTGPAPASIPAPEHNGADRTRQGATPKTVSAPDAAGIAVKDLADRLDEGDAQDVNHRGDDGNPNDVAADGLSQPASGLRYLGVGAHLADPEPAVSEAGNPSRGVCPGWRLNVSRLVLGGRFPNAVVGDVRRLAEETEASPEGTHPSAFLAELVARRARLSGEDLVTLSRAERLGALAALAGSGSDRRLAEAGRARLRLVDGEVLLVPEGVDPGSESVLEAAYHARQRRLAYYERAATLPAKAPAAGRRNSAADRAALAGNRARLASGRPWRVEAVHHVMVPLDDGAVTQSLAPFSAGFVGLLGRHAKETVEETWGGNPETVGGLLEAYRAAYRASRLREASRPASGSRSGPLNPGAGPFNDPRANKKDVARLYRSGLRGKASRLAELGAPAAEVRFWRTFELKDNGDPKGAYAAPVVPFGGTPVAPEEQPEVLRLERDKQAARDSGRTVAEITMPGEWGFRLFRFGRTVCARFTQLSREARVFRPKLDRALGGALGAPSAHCWPVQHTEVLHDPAGLFEAQLAEERVAAGKPPKAAPSQTDRADRLPVAERESGPDLETGSSARGRDPFAAERQQGQEAVIATRSGRALVPSRTPAQRLRAKNRLDTTVAEAREAARTNAPANADGDLRARRDRALAEHLATLPVAERLELFLALRGPVEVSVLKDQSDDPTGVFLAACELCKAGRISMKGQKLSAPALSAEAKRELNRVLLAPEDAPASADVA